MRNSSEPRTSSSTRLSIAWMFAVVAAAPLFASTARAATLPAHDPLRVLIVSDEVNPHGLSAAELTQPGDISAALAAPGSGISLDAVTEIATDDLPLATAALSLPLSDPAAYDVLIYFAHRIPNGAGAVQAQADFVAAVESFLVAGGGVVSLHHGAYLTAGKEAILDLIGGTASGAVPWNTIEGQNVIDVAPGHFVTTNAVTYPATTAYADVPRGVPPGTYGFFNNVPDERYVQFEINPTAGDIEILFASDYVENGSTHVLGFTHRRPGWAGVVVAYQPAEYQPNALDDLDGANFQILANAILYAAGGAPDCSCDDDGDPCTRETCVGGACQHPATPATTCDAGWGTASLLVNERIGGRETLVAKLGQGPALSQTDLGAPLLPGGTTYTLCLYDEGGALAGKAVVDRAGQQCGTKPCWKSIGSPPPDGRGYLYKDPGVAADGIQTMRLRSGGVGKPNLLVKGRNNASLGQSALPTGIAAALAGSHAATLQLHASDPARCFSAALGSVSRNEPTLFKATR